MIIIVVIVVIVMFAWCVTLRQRLSPGEVICWHHCLDCREAGKQDLNSGWQ